MSITITLSSDELRQEVINRVQKAKHRTRVTFDNPEATDKQTVLKKIILREISRKLIWHGEKLLEDEWECMFLASLKFLKVVPGIDDETRIILGIKERDRLSVSVTSEMIEFMLAFAAQNGINV